MIGTTVGKYRILARLGRGGMGTVYRAIDDTLDREVAIKVLNSEISDAKLMARFRAEATMLARLNHPEIATIFEIVKTDTDLMIGRQRVPAGTYTIYTLPSATVWKLIINKQVGQWGTVYNQPQDLARITMEKGPTPSSPVETFKIYFDHTNGNKTQLHLAWENTDVYVPVTAVK